MVVQVLLKIKKGHEPALFALKDNAAILKDTKGCFFHGSGLYFIVKMDYQSKVFLLKK
ncbi:hypothetical protein Pelsub_P2063 [Pelolinea submarina]|nr:hypothetical protein Pelsub_P2063 [Pelolinea submarina]